VGFTLVIANPTGTTMSRDNLHDIVVRLRSIDNFTSQTRDEWILEAANEIERLRRSIRVLQYELEATEDAQNDS
jgi:hypothetical protein